jgi:Yip1 domain
MTGLMDQIVALACLTLNDPRNGARTLLQMDVPLPARTAGLVLVAVSSALLFHLGFFVLPAGDDALAQFMSQSPFRTAIIQWLILAATVLCIYRIGRVFGGKGTLTDALLVVVWLQVIMLAVQLLQLLSMILFTPLAGLVSLAGFVLFFWLLTSFIAELHGFASRWAVLAGVIGSGFAIAIVLALILSMIYGPEALQGV